jgi:hypothetical protein
MVLAFMKRLCMLVPMKKMLGAVGITLVLPILGAVLIVLSFPAVFFPAASKLDLEIAQEERLLTANPKPSHRTQHSQNSTSKKQRNPAI